MEPEDKIDYFIGKFIVYLQTPNLNQTDFGDSNQKDYNFGDLKHEINMCKLSEITKNSLVPDDEIEKKLNNSVWPHSKHKHAQSLLKNGAVKQNFENQCNNNIRLIKYFYVFKNKYPENNNITMSQFVELLLNHSKYQEGGRRSRKYRKTIKKHKGKSKKHRRKGRT